MKNTEDHPEAALIIDEIDELFLKHPFYGSRQMVRQLQRETFALAATGYAD